MNLKGVYVNLSSINLGVNFKVKAITKALNSYDGVSFLLITPRFKQQNFKINEKGFNQLELGIYSNNNLLFCFEKLFLKYFPVKFLRKWKFKNLFFKALLIYQKDNAISFSILRYPFANISLHNFMKKSSSKVFLEFNTFEIDEFKSQNIFYFLNSKYYLEQFFRKKILKHSNGIIGVTNEIINYQNNFYKVDENRKFLISNGINQDYRFAPKNKTELIISFVFLIGEDQPWHGFDRLILSLFNSSLKEDIIIHIIGKLSKKNKSLLESLSIKKVSFKLHGTLPKEKMNNVLEYSHIGIGSLCLFRKNMTEACPLKVRDFAIKGLPIILGYHDTDFSVNNDLNKYTFQVVNDNSLINFNNIISWYKEFNQDELKEFAQTSFDVLSYKGKFEHFISCLRKYS
jgi:hypothetical protein